MQELGVQILFTYFSDSVHWHGNPGVRKTFIMQPHSTEAAKEGITKMISKHLLSKMMLAGFVGLAGMLLASAPSCKAQEVSPAIFTDTGVEDYYPAKKPVAKKPMKVQVVANPVAAAPNQAMYRKPKDNQAARKQNTVFTPGV